MLKLSGCNFNIYQTSIKRIVPKKSIEIKVATAAPTPAYTGIKMMFKTKLIIKTNIEFIKFLIAHANNGLMQCEYISFQIEYDSNALMP